MDKPHDQVPDPLDGYELLEKLGEGGMAVVWKARQISLDRLVAIKMLSPSFTEPDAHERFRQETRHAARLRHPSIVQVYDAGERDGVVYLVMEYIQGQTLGDWIAEAGRLAPADLLRVAEGVAAALDDAWDKECMIHCDLKPDNILIEADTGAVKVADLGLSRAVGIHRIGEQVSGVIVGTPNYVSPEQADGVPDLDCRTDIYSLGATLYHAATGELPFRELGSDGAMEGHRSGQLEDPMDQIEGFPPPVAWLLEIMLVRNRAYRPQLWRDIRKDLEQVRAGRLPTILPEPNQSTLKRSLRRIKPKPDKVQAPKVHIKASALPPRATLPPARPRPSVTSAEASGSLLLALVLAVGTVGCGAWWALRARDQRIHKAVQQPVKPDNPTPEPEVVVSGRPGEGEAPDGFNWEHPAYLRARIRVGDAVAALAGWQTEPRPDVLAEARAATVEALELLDMCGDIAPPGVDLKPLQDQARRLAQQIRAAEQKSPADSPPMEAGLLSLSTRWASQATTPDPVLLAEVTKLFRGQAVPSDQPFRRSADATFASVAFLMPLTEALDLLGQPAWIEDQPLTFFPYPSESLTLHRYQSPKPQAYDELRLVTDLQDQVVIIQLVQTQPAAPKLPTDPTQDRWTLVDPVTGLVSTESNLQAAHRIRSMPPLLRIDSELLASGEDHAGSVSTYRVSTLMPTRLVGIMLYRIAAEP